MTLVNPNPTGYAKGAVLPSADVNSVWEQLPDAVDGSGGGTYDNAPLVFKGDVEVQGTLASASALIDEATIGSTGGIVLLDGTVSFTGVETLILPLPVATLANANDTFTDGDDPPGFKIMPVGASDKTITLGVSTEIQGWWYWFKNSGAGFNLIVEDSGAVGLLSLAAGENCLLVWTGVSWHSFGGSAAAP